MPRVIPAQNNIIMFKTKFGWNCYKSFKVGETIPISTYNTCLSPIMEDVSLHGATYSPDTMARRKEKGIMSSLRKLLRLQQRTANSAAQLLPTQQSNMQTSIPQRMQSGLDGSRAIGPDFSQLKCRAAAPCSSSSMPQLFPMSSASANSSFCIPQFSQSGAGRRVPLAPSSSSIVQLPSIEPCNSPMSATPERMDSGVMSTPLMPFKRTSMLYNQGQARDIPLYTTAPVTEEDENPDNSSTSQPLPFLPFARSSTSHCPAAICVSPQPPALAAPKTPIRPRSGIAPPVAIPPFASGPSNSPILSPTGAAPHTSSPGTGPIPASPRPPAPPTTLLAVCPGTPESMRRPVWRLADYSIGARLYKGEVSSVYKAVCSASGVAVALKVYSLSRVADNALHTLVREIRIHTELAHPHVLMLYGVFEEESRLVLVLERAARGDLFHLHRSLPHCRMSEDQLRVLVLAPLLDALTYLHARGVCHRDIKPENLLMTSSWQLRVADFGAAINLTAERAVTRTGTMDYMAPEVERCPLKAAPEDNKDNLDLAYSTSADVWSLGVLAYEMLVGFPPFVELNSADGRARQAGEGARELSFPAFVSAGGQDFISSALAERPGDRPTAAQLMRHPWVKHAVRQHAVRQQAASSSHNPTLIEQRPTSRGSQQPLQRQLQQAFGATQRSKASAAQAAPRAIQLQEPEHCNPILTTS